MSDNTTVLNPRAFANGAGDTIATDDIAGVKYQRIKLTTGADGVSEGDVSSDHPLPVSGTFWQETQPVSIAQLPTITDADPMPVTIPSSSTMKDAFGRLRVSDPQVLGFGAFEYGVSSFIETKVAGTGAVASVVNESSLSLSTGGTAADASAIAQTRIHHRYVPGRSQLIRFTGSFATPKAGLRQRAGYFNARNGFFIEIDGLDVYFVRRSYVTGEAVDARVARADWVDPWDGTGASGHNLGLTTGTTWLAWFDLEWLGVGRYRFGFASPTTGELLLAHEGAGTNTLAVPYVTTANLPVRYEIENTAETASTSTMKWICYAVDTEGGDEGSLPVQGAVDSGVASRGLADGTFRPVLALRAKATGPNSVPNRGQTIVESVAAIVTGNTASLFRVVLNPTTLTAAGGAVSWTSAGGITEYAAFANAADTVNGGSVLDSFYVPATAQSKGGAESDVYSKLPLVFTELNSVQDVLVLEAAGLGSTSTCYGAITFKEVY